MALEEANVQHIAEVGISIAQAMKDLDALEKLVRDKSVSIAQILQFDGDMGGLFKAFDQPVPRLFSEIAKEATLMEEKIGMSVQSARKQMQGLGHIGSDIVDYFKRDGKKSAVEWTEAFEQEFAGTDFRKLLSPYIKWTENGSGVLPDDLTGELSEKFPVLSKDVFNHTELWERLAEQVRDFRVETKQLAETGTNTYFEQLQQTAKGTGDVFDRLIEQQERLHSAGGFTDGIGKSLMSESDIQAMATHLQEVANIQSKISVTTDESGKATKISIDYVGELNEKWQETYRWVKEVDDESGEITEGFKRISSVATENANAAKKLADEFNRVQLATEKMNLSNIQIFEQSGDTGMADRLRGINAQMGEIKNTAEQITRSDVARAKQLQYQSQLIALTAKEEKIRQQTVAAAAREQKQSAEAIRKEQAAILIQNKQVHSIQKDINKYSLDASGYNAQLASIKEQSAALFEKLRTNQQITEEEREQLKTNQMLLGQFQTQVSMQKSEKVGVLSSEKSGSLLGQSGKWFGAYQIWHGIKQGGKEAIETIRDVETSMMEIARVMELTADQSDRVRDSLFGTAKDMGRDFESTSDIMLRFAQAGYDVAESTEMTKTALLAMNTAELDAVNSTNSMIGILKQWKLEASDLSTVIDKLNYTADANAITTQDLVDGLLRSSSAAKNAKFSFDETVGALVAMREASGRTGKEVGTALNSLIAYTQRGKSQDVFESLGVKVYADEARESLRPLLDVWKDLSELVKAGGDSAINALSNMDGMAELLNKDMAETIGMQKEYNELFAEGLSDVERMDVYNQSGVFRKNYWIALLENFEKIGDVVSDMDNSIGHSARENARYMETLEAKTQQLVTSLQELAVQAGEAGLMDMAKGTVDALTAVTNFTKGVGGLVPVLITLTGLFAILKREKIAGTFIELHTNVTKIIPQLKNLATGMTEVKTATNEAGNAVNAGAAGLAGWIGIATMAIGVIWQIVSAIKAQEEAQKRATIAAAESGAEQAKSLNSMRDEYETIIGSMDSTGIKSKQLTSLQKEIRAAIGEQAKELDLVNGKYDEQLQIINDIYITRLKDNLELQRAAKILAEEEFSKGLDISKFVRLDLTGEIQKQLKEVMSGDFGVVAKIDPQMFLSNLAPEETEETLEKILTLLNDGSVSGNDYAKAIAFISAKLSEFRGKADAVSNATDTVNKSLASIELNDNFGLQLIKTQEEFDELIAKIESGKDIQVGDLGLEESRKLLIEIAQSQFPQFVKSISEATQESASALSRWISEIDNSDKAVSDLKSSISGLESSMQALADGKGLTLDATLDLIDKYPQLASAIHVVGDEWSFEADALEALRQAKYNELIATEASNIAKQIEASLTEEQKTKLYELTQALITATDATARQAVMAEYLAFVSSNAAGDIDVLNAALSRMNVISAAASKAFAPPGSTYRGNAAAIKADTDAINANTKAVQERQKELQKAFDATKKGLQDELKEFEKAHKAEIDLLKEQKEAAEDAHKAALDRLKEQQKAAAERWKEEEKAVKSRYDAEIQALRDIKTETSREDERADYEKTREEILREIEEQKKRTGRDAVERIKELEKALEELDKKEGRRQRDNAIDDQITDLERERDAEIEAIQEKAKAEDERYERRVKNIENEMKAVQAHYEEQIKIQENLIKAEKERVEAEIAEKEKAWEEQKAIFEKQIEGFRKQLDEAKATYEAQIAGLKDVQNETNAVTAKSEREFWMLYERVKQYSDDAARQQIMDLESVFMKIRSIQEAMLALGQGPINMDTFLNGGRGGNQPYNLPWNNYRNIPSSHTGSLVLKEGPVNVAPGEIIVRPDISEGLRRQIGITDRINQILNSYGGHVNNSRSSSVSIDMRGANIGSGVGGQRAGQDVGRAIMNELSNFS